MDWSRYKTMDPHLLVGLVNTELRNHSHSLEDLCKTHDIEQPVLVDRLRAAGYDFNPSIQQFR